MKTAGQHITDMLTERPERRRFDFPLDRKAVTPILSYPPTYETVPSVIPGRTWQYRMRSLIPQGTTVGSAIVYVREVSFNTMVIVPVNPGAPKPQPAASYDVKTQPVITIPAYLKLPAQYWQDFAMLQSWMDSRLMYGLALAEENQFLNGDGTPSNLQGFMAVALPASPPVAPPTPGAAAVLAGVASGVASVFAQGYVPNGIVLNTSDFGLMLFALGAPTLVTVPIALWGIPVVATQAMITGQYLVGQFDPYSQIFDREEAAVEVATQNEDDFIRNVVAVRGEERLALAIYQPSAFAKGTFLLS